MCEFGREREFAKMSNAEANWNALYTGNTGGIGDLPSKPTNKKDKGVQKFYA